MKDRGKDWFRSALINGVGAVVTGKVSTPDNRSEKVSHGAWMMLIAILCAGFLTQKTHQHYFFVTEQLSRIGAKQKRVHIVEMHMNL
jgi:hypothetical protein